MKKIKKEKITKTIEIIDDVLCNKCGRSCKMQNVSDLYGLIETEVHTGFCSPKLGDCNIFIFSLCEFCLSELFDTFKLKVEKRSY